jgi:hypothetical protein
MAQQTFGSIIKTVAATGTPEALGTSATRFHSVAFQGLKAARTDNTGTVWIQPNSGDGTAAMKLEPGDVVGFTADAADDYFTADQFYIDVETAADGVVALYDK